MSRSKHSSEEKLQAVVELLDNNDFRAVQEEVSE